MEPSVAVPLFGFFGVVVTALSGIAIAIITNRREPKEVSEIEAELRTENADLASENAALQRMVDMLLGQLEKKP